MPDPRNQEALEDADLLSRIELRLPSEASIKLADDVQLLIDQLRESEARERAYREALERIVAKDHDMRNPWHEALMIARAALAANPSEEEEA